jgi:hypothetical protein
MGRISVEDVDDRTQCSFAHVKSRGRPNTWIGEMLMSDAPGKFDWDGDDSIVFATVQALAVYVNERGRIVIRQEAGPVEEEDSFVYVPVEQVDALIAAIRSAKAEIEGLKHEG